MSWKKANPGYQQPDRRKWSGWKWFIKSKYGPFVLLFIVAVIITAFEI